MALERHYALRGHTHAGLGGLQNVVEDLTPQLGGELDLNGFDVYSTGYIDLESDVGIRFWNKTTLDAWMSVTTAGVVVQEGRYLRVYDATSNDYASMAHDGTDFNTTYGSTTDINFTGFTTDAVIGNYRFNANQTVGAGQDNYVLTYDNATGKIGLEAAAGGSQTPWTSDIDGGGFGLDNIDRLEIEASGVSTDTATFTHDGTDFNTAFANTQTWNIKAAGDSPVSLWSNYLGAGWNYIQLMNNVGTRFAYYGMDPSDNFVFNNERGGVFQFLDSIHAATGATVAAFDASNTDYVQIYDEGSIAYLYANNNPIYISSGAGAVYFFNAAGTNVRIYEAAGGDYAQFSHDGTDFVTSFVGTTDWELRDVGLVVTSNASYAQLYINADTSNTVTTVNGNPAIQMTNDGGANQKLVFGQSRSASLDAMGNTFNGPSSTWSMHCPNSGYALAFGINGNCDWVVAATYVQHYAGSTQNVTYTFVGGDYQVAPATSPDYWHFMSSWDSVRWDCGLLINERASPITSVAAYGQIWVKTATPNQLWFTDDATASYAVATAQSVRRVTNAAYDMNTAGNWGYNGDAYYSDASNYTITLENSTGTTQMPVGSTFTVVASLSTGTITINEGTSTTLYLEDGTDTAGGCTLAGGMATIYRASSTVYIIAGSGLTA